MTVSPGRISAVRRFSRFYTKRIGLLSDGILDSAWSPSEARVIYELAHTEASGVTGARLADTLELDPGYMSRILRTLERQEMVAKTRSEADRRQVLVRLSKKGRAEYERLRSGSQAQVADLLSGLTSVEQSQLIESMLAIENVLGADRDEALGPRSVTYRSHRPGDMGWIVQRHAELYHASHGWDASFEAMVADIVATFVEKYDPAFERSWIAEVDGRRAGSIALVRKSKTVGQLRLLLVEPWARGLGIGTRLVSECVGQARHVGYRRMVLYTVRGLDPARRLYEAEGFVLTEEAAGHAWGHDHIAQTWELKL
jgi:DNA-binding MarR family transcriptional regulator/N-acetylglutamate synthase-like GNAT family acetyltransferase